MWQSWGSVPSIISSITNSPCISPPDVVSHSAQSTCNKRRVSSHHYYQAFPIASTEAWYAYDRIVGRTPHPYRPTCPASYVVYAAYTLVYVTCVQVVEHATVCFCKKIGQVCTETLPRGCPCLLRISRRACGRGLLAARTPKRWGTQITLGTDIVERVSDFTRLSSPCDEAPCWKITRCALPVAIPARQIPGDATYVGGNYSSNSTRARPRHRHPQLNGRDFISYLNYFQPNKKTHARGFAPSSRFRVLCARQQIATRELCCCQWKNRSRHTSEEEAG